MPDGFPVGCSLDYQQRIKLITRIKTAKIMMTTTIDMRPDPFEPPFFYTQLDILAKNRLDIWQKKGKTLGEGSIFSYCDSGMVKDYYEDGTATDLHPVAGCPNMTKHIEYALHRAKDFIVYHERHADKHGGLNIADCHEWGNAKQYDGSKNQPRSLSYGIRLSFNDGSIRFFTITSKQESEL